MPNRGVVTLIAAGDIGPVREHPEEGFDLTRSILKQGDITFGQLERNLSERGIPQLQSGHGGRTRPGVAKALSEAGFKIVSFASNHTLDWSDEAFSDTLEVLRKNNIAVIGAGRNIAAARQPAIMMCQGIKVGFLGYCSVLPRGYEATEDKPGVAPLRATTAYEPIDWQPGTPPRVITRAYPEDLAAMVKDIKKLRKKVDVLVVSMHWGVHFVPALIAMYQFEVGHAAVDAGADIIIGHHAHILKGIEVYRGKVILYSLGNFQIDSYPGRRSPFDVVYGVELDPEYPTYNFPVDSRKSILARITIADGKIRRVAFTPLWINRKGQPEPLSRSDPRSEEVGRYMEWLCKDQGLATRFSREGDEVVILT